MIIARSHQYKAKVFFIIKKLRTRVGRSLNLYVASINGPYAIWKLLFREEVFSYFHNSCEGSDKYKGCKAVQMA